MALSLKALVALRDEQQLIGQRGDGERVPDRGNGMCKGPVGRRNIFKQLKRGERGLAGLVRNCVFLLTAIQSP